MQNNSYKWEGEGGGGEGRGEGGGERGEGEREGQMKVEKGRWKTHLGEEAGISFTTTKQLLSLRQPLSQEPTHITEVP